MPEPMHRGYADALRRAWHQWSVGLAAVIGVSGSIWLGWWLGVTTALCWLSVAGVGRWRTALVLVVCAGVGGARSAHEWSTSQWGQSSTCSGWARVIEPTDHDGTLVVQRAGKRVQVRTRASDAVLRNSTTGTRVWLDGTCAAVSNRRLLVRHVVGRMRLRWVGVIAHGAKVDDFLGGVHRALQRAASGAMAPDVAALYTGLVIGDDAREPTWMSDAFRRSGLAHLQAVSGENVAFVLAVLRPLLVRLRPVARLSCTLGAIGGFVALTGAQPSVLRAAAMASVAACAFLVGRQVDPVRSLCWCVVALEAIDPFLVWSAGFWLSVGATLGIVWWAPVVQRRLGGPRWLRVPLAVTLSAQLGTAAPSLLVFHRLSVLGVVANLVAVPVAGVVMLIGLPVGVLVGMSPTLCASPLGHVVMWPCSIGTRWVLDVARVAAVLEPAGGVEVAAWGLFVVCVVGWLVARRRSVPI